MNWFLAAVVLSQIVVLYWIAAPAAMRQLYLGFFARNPAWASLDGRVAGLQRSQKRAIAIVRFAGVAWLLQVVRLLVTGADGSELIHAALLSMLCWLLLDLAIGLIEQQRIGRSIPLPTKRTATFAPRTVGAFINSAWIIVGLSATAALCAAYLMVRHEGLIDDERLLARLTVVLLGCGAWCIDLLYLRPRRMEVAASGSAGDASAGHTPSARTTAGFPTRAPAPLPPAWIDYTAGLFPVLALMFLLRAFLFEPFVIPSGSMLPTLLIGDFIIVNKFAYGFRLPIANRKILAIGDPKVGEVIVFRHPNHPETDLIKRVVGVSGDRIVYRDKRLTINGHGATYAAGPDYVDAGRTLRRQQEALGGVEHAVLEIPGQPAMAGTPDNFPGREFCNVNRNGFACTVPQGHYFMMGDNRDNSADSRYWGFVPDANIVGKAFFVWMKFRHLEHIGAIDPPA